MHNIYIMSQRRLTITSSIPWTRQFFLQIKTVNYCIFKEICPKPDDWYTHSTKLFKFFLSAIDYNWFLAGCQLQKHNLRQANPKSSSSMIALEQISGLNTHGLQKNKICLDISLAVLRKVCILRKGKIWLLSQFGQIRSKNLRTILNNF